MALRSRAKYLVWTTLIVVSLGACSDVDKIDLGQDYLLSNPTLDHTKLWQNGRVVVDEAIVSYDYTAEYIVGLRLMTKPMICSNGQTTFVTNDRRYFIVDKLGGVVLDFPTRNLFEKKLRSINIDGRVSLDYSQLDYIWNYFSSRYSSDGEYWKSCRPLSPATK